MVPHNVWSGQGLWRKGRDWKDKGKMLRDKSQGGFAPSIRKWDIIVHQRDCKIRGHQRTWWRRPPFDRNRVIKLISINSIKKVQLGRKPFHPQKGGPLTSCEPLNEGACHHEHFYLTTRVYTRYLSLLQSMMALTNLVQSPRAVDCSVW